MEVKIKYVSTERKIIPNDPLGRVAQNRGKKAKLALTHKEGRGKKSKDRTLKPIDIVFNLQKKMTHYEENRRADEERKVQF